MIKSWRHKGLKDFFETESKAGIRPDHAAKLKRLLSQLDYATAPQDMNLPGFGLHELEDDLKGHYAVKVNANWRITFTFEGTDAVLVDYLDYH